MCPPVFCRWTVATMPSNRCFRHFVGTGSVGELYRAHIEQSVIVQERDLCFFGLPKKEEEMFVRCASKNVWCLSNHSLECSSIAFPLMCGVLMFNKNVHERWQWWTRSPREACFVSQDFQLLSVKMLYRTGEAKILLLCSAKCTCRAMFARSCGDRGDRSMGTTSYIYV